MLVKLTDSVEAEIVYQEKLPWMLSWEMRAGYVIIGPYLNMDEHEQHYLKTIGSGDWHAPMGSEFRFDKDNLLLKSIWVKALEENLESGSVIEEWTSQQPIEGILRLLSSQDFYCEANDYRWMSPDGKLLAAITETNLVRSNNKIRLRVAKNFELLFAEQEWCGWLLHNPAQYLTEPNSQAKSDRKLALWASEYLTLVSEPYIEQMEDEEAEILEKLLDLRNRIDLTSGAIEHRQVIKETVEDVIEHFYGSEVLLESS